MECKTSSLQIKSDSTTQQKKSSTVENRGSHRSADVTRRWFLMGGMAGVMGLGVLKSMSSAAAATGEHTLEISGVGEYTTYSFAASGDVDGKSGITGEDDVNGRYATGAVGGGTDTYTFTGKLLAFNFDRSGTVDVELDGGPAYVGQRPDQVLEIAGTGDPAQYAFDVGSNLEHTEAIGSVQSNDHIDGTHGEGEVGGGTDAYLFDGDLEAFSLNGRINAYLNGEPAHVGQRPDSEFRYSDGGGGGGSGDLELEYNARARSHDRGNTFENFSDFSMGWAADSGELSANATDDWDNNDPGAATLISSADNDRVQMSAHPSSENFAYRDVSMAVRLRGTSNETLRVELAAGDGSEKQITTRYLSEKHGWVRMGLGPSAWSGTPDMADINEFSISCYTGSKSCEIDVDDIRTTPKRDNGAVVFIFDDANETDYTTAYDVLSSRGYAGSSAIIPRVVGDDGKLSQRQMDQMDSDGWAWPNHPQADSRSGGLGSVSGDKAEQMMRDNKRWLLDNGYERGADTLVWPFGDFDAEALDIAGDYYRLAWGGGSSATNGIITESSWLPRIELNESGDVQNALAAVEEAYRTETVVTTMTHGMGGGNLDADDLNRMLDRIEKRGLDVLTTADFAGEQ
jgi:hypothetical protein